MPPVLLYKQPAVGQQSLSGPPCDRGSPWADMVNDALKRAPVSRWSHLRKSFNVLQLEIRDKFCAARLGGAHGRLDGWSSRGLANFEMSFPHIACVSGSKSVQFMCAAGTLCDYDTTICRNVGRVRLEHLEMWVIFNLGSLFVRKEIYSHISFCESCCVKANQPIESCYWEFKPRIQLETSIKKIHNRPH